MITAIEYLKTSISISSYSGCSIGCKYCILSSMSNHNTVNKIFDEKELVDSLINNKYFVKNFTCITINNRTDPFLNSNVKESTFKILDNLEVKGLKNTIILITKAYLNDNDINKLAKYKSNIFVFYTYSGISESLENRKEKMQLKTIKKLSNLRNIKLIHYWRPVIEGINTSDEIITKVSKVATQYFQASVVSGIRINSYLKDIFKKEQLDILFHPNSEHKIIYDETYDRILKKVCKLKPNYNCFRKTSCCISSFNKEQDYNANCYNKKICFDNCINYKVCNAKKRVSIDEFKKLLANIGLYCDFKITEKDVLVDCDLDQEQKMYLTHNSKMKIRPRSIKKCLSEEVLSK